MTKDLMTIVIISCDEYEDVWNNCISLLKYFWTHCPYKIIFVNQEKEVSWPGIEVIHAGKGAEWSLRTSVALDKCKTPYVCLFVEDFFVGDFISNAVIENMLKIISKHNITYYKITNFSRAVRNHDPIFKKYPFLHVIFQDDDYGISVQPSVWKINYLRELLGTGNYNAWKFEFARVKEAERKQHILAPGCVFDERNILHIRHGLMQGKYLPGTINYFRKLGIHLNIKRPILTWHSYYWSRIISKCKYTLPKPWRKPVKKFLEKCGVKFVSTIRDI